jgi:hypothetical protein
LPSIADKLQLAIGRNFLSFLGIIIFPDSDSSFVLL